MDTIFPNSLKVQLMKHALELAKEGEKRGEVPVGAIIVSEDGRIIASAHNSPISTNDPTAHAEILALRKAGEIIGNYRLTNLFLFTTLEPCLMCAGALVWARIKGLFFGAFDKRAGAFGSVVDINAIRGLNHKIEVHGGILEEECSNLLKNFFKKRR